MALGATRIPDLSKAELELVRSATIESRLIPPLERLIHRGEDPLGEWFCQLRSPAVRRSSGATYTPTTIIDAMISWSQRTDSPVERVVDPGSGSGRFLVKAAAAFPTAQLIAIEKDPLASLMTRANLASKGLADRSCVINEDFRASEIGSCSGRTLFIGNPPYVRHHDIEPAWKEWLSKKSLEMGLQASQLAGLHVHFLLATLLKAKKKDFGAFITSAEWLDVNYGHLAREMFVGHLGGLSITVVEPTAAPFPDAATTAAITCFEVGSAARSIKLNRVESVAGLALGQGKSVGRDRLQQAPRWSFFTRVSKKLPADYIELGELCRVHRGQVTGSNSVWIEGAHSQGLPDEYLFPTVTRAREIIVAGTVLDDPAKLRRVIDLPKNLDLIDPKTRRIVDSFLLRARQLGADESYVAKNRRAWWSVGLKEPAPILATYMARRPPAFVRNKAQARHINIAHGIYPRQPLSDQVLTALIEHLSSSTDVGQGRTYAGGLTKFEPREMERLPVPSLEMLIR